MSSGDNLKTYRGNCHCGAFVYEAKLPEITSYTECNCSICRKKGYAYLIPNEVEIVKGSIDDLATYTFNEGGFVHRFCPSCGTAVLGLSRQRTIINVSGRAERSKTNVRGGSCLRFSRPGPYRTLTYRPSMSSRKLW